MTATFWDAHAAARLTQGPVIPLDPPPRMEWTQRPGIGPGTEIIGEDLTGRRIVELGCGAGHNTAHLTAAGAAVVGVDRSAGQIRRAVAHYGHTGAQFRHADALPYLTRASQGLDVIFSVFGAIGTSEPTRLLSACARSLTHHGILAFCLPHPQRTGAIPAYPRTRDTATLQDGRTHLIEHWDMAPVAWTSALNQAGLTVSGVYHLHAPADARWPTTLLITARKL
ncbi:class I SAM-dependent methyltransferase [Actinoplanes flavus]|uniref:Class I SAM-dependent methyltransferase n=1 Tax=Actinoplanes flavus TaxID=2820290 RepID=A0ABS3UT35_9ACTN|nr:class I SAM-dependent methyltransferase [Actinoplanes flavus]MBO3741751.1 class I SAM-dependent methyltransferase [Actinoplanes flavus]